jgi:uncharacterized protein
MPDLINTIISTFLQILVFILIPFIFFLLRKNKQVSFSKYIGFYPPTGKSVIYVLVAGLLFVIAGIGLVISDETIRQAVHAPKSVTGNLRMMGLNVYSILILLTIALLKTSLSEEIFFRGFIAKQLIAKLGFKTGNIIQALIFGIVHLVLFQVIINSGFSALAFIFIFSTSAGWVIGYIKEKHANGSIIPGWIAHGLGNTLSYYVIAFVL